jgi:hypothetical protein
MKMFKEFLPSFPARCTVNGAVRSLPKGINKRIQAAIEERNRIVHGSTGVVSTDLYADWLLAVQDLLYLLDYYRGHAWAWDLLSTGCKSGLSSAG